MADLVLDGILEDQAAQYYRAKNSTAHPSSTAATRPRISLPGSAPAAAGSISPRRLPRCRRQGDRRHRDPCRTSPSRSALKTTCARARNATGCCRSPTA